MHNIDSLIKHQNSKTRYWSCYYPSHPKVRRGGSIYLHRLVMENKLGRYLESYEVVHHINGDRENNSEDNLQVLTSQKAHNQLHRPPRYSICRVCKKEFRQIHWRIKTCSTTCGDFSRRRVARPTKEILLQEVWSQPTVILAKKYNVSDVAISKWCKKYGISKPPRGHWEKVYHVPIA